MAKKLHRVLITDTSEKNLQVWVDDDVGDILKDVEGVYLVNDTRFVWGCFSVHIDPRFDKQSIIDDIYEILDGE